MAAGVVVKSGGKAAPGAKHNPQIDIAPSIN